MYDLNPSSLSWTQVRAATEEGAEPEDSGVRQIELMRWYMDTQAKR